MTVNAAEPPTPPEWVLFGRAALAVLVARRAAAAADGGGGGGGGGEAATAAGTAEAAFAAAADALAAALAERGAFAALVRNAGLDGLTAEVLALLATTDSDPDAQRLLGTLQGDTTPARVALRTLAELFADRPLGALGVGPDGALRTSALTEVGGAADAPWLDHRAGVHPTVVWSLLGDPGRDPGLDPAVTDVTVAEPGTTPLATVAVVTGGDRARRRLRAAEVARGTTFIVTPAPTTDAGWAAVVREATITGQGVIVELDDALAPAGRRWVERATHLAWALTSVRDVAIADLPRRGWVAVHVPATPVSDDEWAAHLGDAPREHHLDLEQLGLVAQAAGAYGGDLDAAVRRLVSGKLEQVTRRVHPRYAWDDLVLSPDRKGALHTIADRYRHSEQVYDTWGFSPAPSRGTVALFSGPSGTGKSMAAEVVAGALHLDLFKLDLSAVVSKYIGETEKNLDQVFDAAGAGNLLLFFDEADALFGKRSEVSDARDRYANIEVSYLLQRLEMYDGLVILATNFERNIDEAFIRRIHTRLEFTRPGPDEREAIWASNLPGTAPVDGVDTAWLAKAFDLTGGQIRNAVVKAAFLAASAGTPLTMHSAVIGVAHELRKQGRLLKLSDFGEYADVVQEAQQHGLV